MTRDQGSDAAWERRLRALDDELASYGAGASGGAPADASVGGEGGHVGVGGDGGEGGDRMDDRGDIDEIRADGDIDEIRADGDIDDGEDVASDDEPVETEESAAARRRKAIFDWVVVIGVALLVAFLVRTFVLAHFVVDGVSMSTTLHDDDRVFVNKLSYRLHDPHRGDVVVLHQLNGASERDLIKRVIALPGEEIRFEDCVVYIDGGVLQEPYLDPPATTPGTCGRNIEAQVVPEDHVFVMGDNRGGSMDSRDLGPIPEHDLVGRAFVVFWPQSHWQWL
jgi:signal peptidase I